MKEDMIFVTSQSDCTLVINIPELNIRRTWPARGSRFPFERDTLEQAFYDPSVEYLFRHGLLVTDDETFLIDVGLMDAETKVKSVVELNETLLKRMIKLMPLNEFKQKINELSVEQISELADYAIDHYKDLNMDRAELITKRSGKNILKSIENFKQQEA